MQVKQRVNSQKYFNVSPFHWNLNHWNPWQSLCATNFFESGSFFLSQIFPGSQNFQIFGLIMHTFIIISLILASTLSSGDADFSVNSIEGKLLLCTLVDIWCAIMLLSRWKENEERFMLCIEARSYMLPVKFNKFLLFFLFENVFFLNKTYVVLTWDDLYSILTKISICLCMSLLPVSYMN